MPVVCGYLCFCRGSGCRSKCQRRSTRSFWGSCCSRQKDEPEKVGYFSPKKEIMRIDDMVQWEKSDAYFEYTMFVMAMNYAVEGKKISDAGHISQIVNNLIAMLEKLDEWIDEIPPIEQPRRFGNKAFQDWFKKLKEESENLLKDVLPEKFHSGIVELSVYLYESVGNSRRIDYGTGHEMSFAVFLYCLFKVGALKKEDSEAAILKVFNRYLSLMRKLQLTYHMEPAGSHGAWSLDDYQFLPFIWGSSQLIGHQLLKPASFLREDVVDEFENDYMFLGCTKFINQAKTGPFEEHSNRLWNISSVVTWTKVNSDLIKMYKAEVLGKFPVIQHLLFGSLFSIKRVDPVKQQLIEKRQLVERRQLR